MLDEIREFALALAGSNESFPFDDKTLVYKVGGKMFLVLALEKRPIPITVKCKPEEGERLREQYNTIQPAYHFNKRHWITLTNPASLPFTLICSLIRTSYDLVYSGLTRKERQSIENA
ncbi:MAG: MmcQ/YjbR family DNA-binding protein [Bacteroides sp.]|jgi:hypothetical protein